VIHLDLQGGLPPGALAAGELSRGGLFQFLGPPSGDPSRIQTVSTCRSGQCPPGPARSRLRYRRRTSPQRANPNRPVR
jgi:hypothetical protein